LIGLIAVLALVARPGEAYADEVDTLIERMTSSGDYKERLSAALNLSKLGDPRAIPAFLATLADSNKTVRGVAAAALGKLVSSETPVAVRERALRDLERAAAEDADSFVRKQAQKAHEVIAKLEAAGARRKLYVNVGPMSDASNAGDGLVGAMRSTVTSTLAKRAPHIKTTWPDGKSPTKKQLDSAAMPGFYIDGAIEELVVDKRGGSALVSCKVRVLVASYPERSMFGFASGAAKVQAGASAKDVGYAREDCVVAVVEDLIARRIIPTIEERAN
jgi:hypothetical protein